MIDKIPVKAWLADALFKATAVVPIKNVLLPELRRDGTC
jgi:hypothetical protein